MFILLTRICLHEYTSGLLHKNHEYKEKFCHVKLFLNISEFELFKLVNNQTMYKSAITILV